MSKILLYHTGYQVIQNPDIYYGRKNADFGQGFYLTENLEFSKRWAREKKGTDTYVNVYGLELHGFRSIGFKERKRGLITSTGIETGKRICFPRWM